MFGAGKRAVVVRVAGGKEMREVEFVGRPVEVRL
jgi:hypothetical protein